VHASLKRGKVVGGVAATESLVGDGSLKPIANSNRADEN